MKAAGLKFVKISPQERKRFRDATQNVKNVTIKRISDDGRKLVKMLVGDIAKYSN